MNFVGSVRSLALQALLTLASSLVGGAACGTGGSARATTPESCRLHFTEETLARGIDFVQDNGQGGDFFFVEMLGSGAIFFDADGDGDSDLYLLNQTKILPPPRDPAPHSIFYLNDGTGRFSDATIGSGLLDGGYALGVCGADVENDGDMDLYVTRFDSANSLYRNDGHATFTDVTAQAGVAGGADMNASCAFGDVDNDGFVDLFVSGYGDNSRRRNPECYRRLKDGGQIARAYCNVRDVNPIPDVFYRNRGDGTFEDATAASGLAGESGRSLGAGFSDADLDGDQDLYVACDRTASLFYENDGHGRFTQRAQELGIAFSTDGNEEAGMGMAWGDFNGDGLPDLVKTNYEFEPNNLFRNDGHLSFTDVAGPAGIGPDSFAFLGWGVEFLDLDNDADLDLFVANGHVRDTSIYVGRKEAGEGYEQFNLLHENVGGGRYVTRREDAGTAMTVRKVGRGLAAADIDSDGDLDLLVTNLNDRPTLYVNRTAAPGHWLEVRCRGTRSNSSAIGTRVTVELPGGTITREVRSGQSYLSQSDLLLHFGLGQTTTVPRLAVRWPSGLVETRESIPADRRIELVEGA